LARVGSGVAITSGSAGAASAALRASEAFRLKVLRGQRDAIADRTAAGLRALGESLQATDAPTEKADVSHAIYERIMVAGPEIVGVRLTQAAYAHGLALALPEKVEMARPTGVGRAAATYEIPIEGRDEWLAAAGLGA